MVPLIEVDASDRRLNGSWLFCFPELGPSCLRPTKMEDRMDVGLILHCTHWLSVRCLWRSSSNMKSAEFPCRSTLKLQEQKFPHSLLSPPEMFTIWVLYYVTPAQQTAWHHIQMFQRFFFPSVWLQCVRGGLTSWPAVHGGLSRLSVPQPNFNGLSSFNGCCHWRQ